MCVLKGSCGAVNNLDLPGQSVKKGRAGERILIWSTLLAKACLSEYLG